MTRPRFYFSIGAANSGFLRGMGRGASLQHSRNTGNRSQSRAVRRSVEGSPEARAMQTVRSGMYSGKPSRSVDGVVGRIMRSLLQLRASEGRPGESPRVGVT